MSTRVRYNSAGQVFETLPRAAASLAATPGEAPPLDFLRALIARPNRFDAITFAAFLLPRREAVWWGCQCLRALAGRGPDEAALVAAEAWVRKPDDDSRRAALAFSEGRDRRTPGDWIALAAGHSGGNIAPDGAPPQQPPAYMTALAVKAGVILALASKPASDQPKWTAACAEAALRFAEGGDAKVRAPT